MELSLLWSQKCPRELGCENKFRNRIFPIYYNWHRIHNFFFDSLCKVNGRRERRLNDNREAILLITDR